MMEKSPRGEGVGGEVPEGERVPKGKQNVKM